MRIGLAVAHNANIEPKVAILFQRTLHGIENPLLGIAKGTTTKRGQT